ncbi:MAG TPA: hypothetical protein VIL88_17740 [Devosia sp.]|jgi:transcriptional regulator of acetoin/glycerol metabolism|uniref:hypothetical protein n=1 Tax=Devosia sp. TaxID=1871048 RepID=UPI002F937C76
MRGQEILPSIAWAPDTDPATIRQIEDAILALDARAHGNGQRVLHPLEADRRLAAFIAKHGSAAAAARALDISRGTLYDMQCGRRKLSPRVQAAIGLRRIPPQPERYEEI